MATQTLYRPVGTVEIDLIARGGWTSFPEMPDNFAFYVYQQPLGDLRDWLGELDDDELVEYLEHHQHEVVQSWHAWGNSFDEFYLVWFEIDSVVDIRFHEAVDINVINRAMVGKIEICARYGPSDVWVDPRLTGY